jgi:alpha-L-rhamnosidase
MNSYNHYAYGAVGSWLYGRVAGIRPDLSEPGFRHVVVEPVPGGGLTWATGELETMYGLVRSSWKIEDGRFQLDVTIPPNATGTVVLPCSSPGDIAESGNSLEEVDGVSVLGEQGNRVSLRVESGRYEFATPIPGR